MDPIPALAMTSSTRSIDGANTTPKWSVNFEITTYGLHVLTKTGTKPPSPLFQFLAGAELELVYLLQNDLAEIVGLLLAYARYLELLVAVKAATTGRWGSAPRA